MRTMLRRFMPAAAICPIRVCVKKIYASCVYFVLAAVCLRHSAHAAQALALRVGDGGRVGVAGSYRLCYVKSQ
jgi:hypothetical protein